MNQSVNTFYDFALTYNHYAYTTYATRFLVGGFEIDGGKVFHAFLFYMIQLQFVI